MVKTELSAEHGGRCQRLFGESLFILLVLSALNSSTKPENEPELQEGYYVERHDSRAGEAISIVERLIPEEASRYRPSLNDLVVELASQSAGLRSSLPEGVRAPLAYLVRSMDCYYLNSPAFFRRLCCSVSVAVRTRLATACRYARACVSGCRTFRCSRTHPALPPRACGMSAVGSARA